MKKFETISTSKTIGVGNAIPKFLIGRELPGVATGEVSQRQIEMTDEQMSKPENSGCTHWDLRSVQVTVTNPEDKDDKRTFFASYETEIEQGTEVRVLGDTYINRKSQERPKADIVKVG